MKNVGIIIPDRGDRERLTDFCLKQLSEMTIQPLIFHINYSPLSEQCDIIPRIQQGVRQAKAAKVNWCFVIENDDAYPSDYFDRFLPYLDGYDFIGDEHSTYYNIFTRRWETFTHANRSSLFTTAFQTNALDDFSWPREDFRFLDIPLWEYASKTKAVKFVDSGAIGIKHGIGKCGGLGHVMRMRNEDPNMDFLKSKLAPIHIEFYHKLKKECNLV